MLFATSPFKERRRLQRLGPRAGRGRVRHLAARRPASTRVAARRHLRRLRLRALRAHVREPRAARGRRVRALRVRRDPDQHAHLRRRRHLRALQHGRRRQRLGAVRLRPRVRPPLRRRSPTSTTRRRWPTRRRRRARRAVGAERHGAARPARRSSGAISSSRARRCPTPWQKDDVRSRRRARIRSGARRFAPRTGRRRRWTRSSAEGRAFRGEAVRRREVRRQGRRLRGRELRGEGLLPARSGLHHVHAQRGVLRRVPPRHRNGHQPVLPTEHALPTSPHRHIATSRVAGCVSVSLWLFRARARRAVGERRPEAAGRQLAAGVVREHRRQGRRAAWPATTPGASCTTRTATWPRS